MSHDYSDLLSNYCGQTASCIGPVIGLAFRTKALIDETCGNPVEVSTTFSMFCEIRNGETEDLQHLATTVLKNGAANAADSLLRT